ncbi:hypothetical protein [Virgibacillus necropolis]|uniref:Threonyl/alanyl tRNA synthetase SAD domain-containing protein n=1 Tax=Virgibacillus necropolis TaxID=163877 RepID=A0A221MI28_9BACI|nr:hypothetical protein CFK40_04580 [Virgibacillus necropolis]
MGDIDEQACGGTHVRNTNEIGEISLERTNSKGKGVMRMKLKLVNWKGEPGPLSGFY